MQNTTAFWSALIVAMEMGDDGDQTNSSDKPIRSAKQRSASAVKRMIVSTSVIALLAGVLSLSNSAFGEPGKEPAADNSPHKVALIDMAHVFKNYKKFEALREELKKKISTSEEQAKELQREMADLQQQMKDMKEGTPKFTETEAELVSKAADFESFKRKMSREFLKEESQIYLNIYNEVSDAVKWYAERKHYTLVMRFNKDEVENENPQTMLQNMNRQVVYFREDDDITKQILNLLNNKWAKENPGSAAPAASEKQPLRTTDKPKSTNAPKQR